MEKINRVQSIINWFRNHPLLLLILIAGFFIRFYGIYFDYPGVNYITDEIYHVSFILKLLDSKGLEFPILRYPLFLSILYFPALVLKIAYTALNNDLFSIASLKSFFINQGMGTLYIITRWYSVFFGTATILLIYRIFFLIFKNKIASGYAASVLALSLIPVFLSHWGKVHSAMILFLMLALYFILRYEQEKRSQFFYYSILAAAFSFSSHYLGIIAFAFPLFGFLFNRKLFNRKIIFKTFLSAIIPILLFYGLNFKGIIWMIESNFQEYYSLNNYVSMYPLTILERFYYTLKDAILVDPIFISLFIFLLIFRLKSIWANRSLRYIVSILALYYIMMVVIGTPHVSRYISAFLILASTLSAAFVMHILLEKGIKKIYVITLAVILILPNLAISIKWLSLLNKNTRMETTQWLTKNLNRDEIAYSFDFYLDAPLSYDAALWLKQRGIHDDSEKINYIVANKDIFNKKGLRLFYDHFDERYEELAGDKTEYIIMHYWKMDDVKPILEEIKKYHGIVLTQAFYPTKNKGLRETGIDDYLNNPTDWRVLWHLQKSGPFMEIYKVL